MLKKNKPVTIVFCFAFVQLALTCFMRECASFQGQVNSDGINVRSDSTVTSEVICKVDKGDPLEVILELYDWYKIKLPRKAPLFIKKSLVSFVDEKTAKVTKDNVNLRLRPDESSPILGRLGKDAVVNVLDDKKDWCRIEPVDNSFGWIHKDFVDKIPEIQKKEDESVAIKEAPYAERVFTVEGIVRPKAIKTKASHKLITDDKSVFALKGRVEELDRLNYRKARATGRLIQNTKIIELEKIEALD